MLQPWLVSAGEAVLSKEEAISLAFKEEAFREAFQEAQMGVLSLRPEDTGGLPDILSHVHPYLDYRVVYDDNVWLVKDNVQSDMYFGFTPGVKLTLGNFEESYSSRLQQGLEVDIGADIVHSLYRSVDLNRESPYLGLNYSLGSGKSRVNIGNLFKRGYELQSELSVDARGLARYHSNDTDLSWEYSFNRFGVGLGYNRRAFNYFGDYKLRNSFSDSMGILTGFFNATPKTRLFVEYDYGKYDYTKYHSNIDNYHYNKFWIGGEGNFTKKLSGLAKIGFQNTKFTKGTKENTATIDTGLTFRQSPKNTFYVDLFYGDLTTDYADEGIDQRTSMHLGFSHNFNSKLNMRANAYFDKDDYDSNRKDDTYRYSLSFRYAFRKWMNVVLEYVFRNRTSNVDTAGYKSNKYSLKAELEF